MLPGSVPRPLHRRSNLSHGLKWLGTVSGLSLASLLPFLLAPCGRTFYLSSCVCACVQFSMVR